MLHTCRDGPHPITRGPPAFLSGGDARYWLGTDNLGRDVLSRMIMGARVSLGVGLGAVVIGSVLGSAIGLIAGMAASLLSMRFIRSLLFGVKPSDPAALIFAAAMLLVISVLAGYVPARRATKVDPMEALRYE